MLVMLSGICALNSPALAQPANDLCGQNISQFIIPPAGGMVSGTLIGAARDALGTSCPVNDQTGTDVYHYLTPAITGVYVIQTCGFASFDTVLSVHTGPCPVTPANEVANGCNDDSPLCGLQSYLSVLLTAGQMYIVRVGTFQATTSPGAYTLKVTFTPQVPNDECAATAPAIVLDSPVSGDNSGATTSITLNPSSLCGTTAGSGGGADMFYRFVPPVPGGYIFSTCGSALDTVLSIHTSCPATEANLVACNDDAGTTACATSGLNSQITASLQPGVTYFVRVAGWRYGGAAGPPRTGPFTLLVKREPTAAPIGACCVTGAPCTFASPAQCPAGYRGDNSPCTPDPCAPSMGACCWSVGGCSGTIPSACVGAFHADIPTCAAANCPQPAGACCIGAICTVIPASQCVSPAQGVGAVFPGGPSCGNGSSTIPCCVADFNKMLGVNVADIFAYLSAWFAGSPFAHLANDGSGMPVVADIFRYLGAWFAGGC